MNQSKYQQLLEINAILEKDKHKPDGEVLGLGLGLLASNLYYLADAEYLINFNIDKYRKLQKKGVCLRLTFFQLYDQGQLEYWSRVTMLNYKHLFRALASGDIGFAVEFAGVMGGRDKAEKENDHPFDYCLGYLLKYLVLGEDEKAKNFLDQFEVICGKRGSKSYGCFVPVFRAILEEDEGVLNKGLAGLEKGCSRLRKLNEASPFKYLNTWGIGLANLAIHRGMEVEIDDEFIPRDLLIER